MVDNQHNYYKTAPDKGKQNGPVWAYSGSLDKYMSNLREGRVVRGGYAESNKTITTTLTSPSNRSTIQATDYWLKTLGPLGTVSLCAI